MVHGVTCMLLLVATFATRGMSQPLGQVIDGILGPDMVARVQEVIGELQLDTLEIDALIRVLENIQQEQMHPQPMMTAEKYEMLREAHQRQRERLESQIPEQNEEELQPNQLQAMESVDSKRGGYMSLCHFKICNMGRKRAVGGAAPLMKSP